MVVKRTCSFCAGEIEPGTGAMFVKKDGTVFHFCSSSCRKQQLHLGRVGHRLKWTRAHAIKKAAEQAGPKGSGGRANARARGKPKPAPAVKAPSPAPASTPEAPAKKGPAKGPKADAAPSSPSP